MQTLETQATVAPVASTETVALVVPRFTIVTGEELAEGKTSKRSYLETRVAAGIEKKQALAEFEQALAIKRVKLTAVGSALLTQFPVERIKETATGWNLRILNTTASRKAAENKAAERIAKLEAKLAELKSRAAK